MISHVAQLQATRRYITGVLLNVDISAKDVNLDTFLAMLDHWIEYPKEYKEIIREHN